MPRINSKRKGKRGELEAKDLLSRLLGVTISRTAQTKGGKDSHDLDYGPINFEVKLEQHLSITKAMLQAIGDCGGDQIPAIVHKVNRSPWMITVCYNTVIGLCKVLAGTPGYHEDSYPPGASGVAFGGETINLKKFSLPDETKRCRLIFYEKDSIAYTTFLAEDMWKAVNYLLNHTHREVNNELQTTT